MRIKFLVIFEGFPGEDAKGVQEMPGEDAEGNSRQQKTEDDVREEYFSLPGGGGEKWGTERGKRPRSRQLALPVHPLLVSRNLTVGEQKPDLDQIYRATFLESCCISPMSC